MSSLRSHAVFVLQEVRNNTVTFLLLKIPTLKIKTVAKKEVFEANLKSECDLWHLMVNEMWAGKKLADDHKVWAGRSCGRGWHRVLKGACRACSTLERRSMLSARTQRLMS